MSQLKTLPLIIMLVFMNVGGAVLIEFGWADGMGVEPSVGGGEQINETNQKMGTVNSSQASGLSGTFMGNVVGAINAVLSVFELAYLGPTMIKNLLGGQFGVLVDFIFAPLFILIGIDLIRFVRG